MPTIGGALDEYKEHPTIKMLAEQSRDCDYIIAPIADNRMFQIINSLMEKLQMNSANTVLRQQILECSIYL